jgi:hypothetical protein
MIEAKKTTVQELIKGRALKITIHWNEQVTALINVCAPNRRQEHEDFWGTITTANQESGTPNPDFVLGDFNLTENAIDRYPPKPDNTEATVALRNFRLALEIQDQWRHEYPKSISKITSPLLGPFSASRRDGSSRSWEGFPLLKGKA